MKIASVLFHNSQPLPGTGVNGEYKDRIFVQKKTDTEPVHDLEQDANGVWATALAKPVGDDNPLFYPFSTIRHTAGGRVPGSTTKASK